MWTNLVSLFSLIPCFRDSIDKVFSYTLKLKLVMTLEGALMKFSLEIDGVLYGSVEANYSP